MTFKSFLYEFWWFGLKQAYACVFGGFLLAVMAITHFCYPIEGLHRYDFIFLSAIAFQVMLLATKLETWREASVIVIFHLVATAMELFKTSNEIGSWSYPEAYYFGIGQVPLFTGFMYSAVGSYIARIWRIFEFEFSYYPPNWTALVLVLLIYVNFFSHHYVLDIRWALLAATVILFGRANIYFKVLSDYRQMPLLLGWFLVALFIWLAENLATFANIWVYPNQSEQWQMVSLSKLNAWFLLMLLSFVLVSQVNKVKVR